MKGFIKLMPAALGLLTLASCSNEDSFVSDSIAGKTTMIVTTEDDATTRAYADKDLAFTWGVNDQIRAYDKNMQAYDNYKYNVDAAKFVVDNDPQYVDNANYGYAIFGEDISYNGWQQDGATGVLTALVKIPASIEYKEAYKKYKAALPMWGVANNAGDHLEVDLKYLTGIAIMQFSNGKQSGVQKVRVRSLKWKSTADDSDKAAVRALQQGEGVTLIDNACDPNPELPLSGWFNARMEINEDATVDSLKYGKMEKLANGPLATYENKDTKIEVNISDPATSFALDDNTIFIPIVPAWYEVLSFEYTTDNGTTWKVFRTLAAKSDGTPTAKVGRNTKIRGMVMNTAATASVTSATTSDLSTKIATAVNGKTIDVVVTNTSALATSDLEAGYTLFLPQLASNLTLNLAANNNFGTHALLIKDVEGADNSNYTVTINFNSFDSSSKEIEVNTKANLVVTGNFTHLPSGTSDAITVSNAKSITLGDATTAFTTVNTASTKTQVTVNKGDVTVNNIEKGDGAGLALINNASTANTVTINSADVTVTDTKASEMNINAASTVTTAAATININAAATDQVALTLHKGVTAINLKGGIISSVSGGSGSTAFATGSKIAVTSSGKSAITCVPTVTNVTFSYTSSYDGSADGDAAPMNNFIAAGSEIAVNTYKYVNGTNINSKTTPIYTAAQLAAIGNASSATAFVLLTEITELKGWTPVALSKNFYGQAKEIKKIDAPLFGAVSGTTRIDGVKITNADITTTGASGTGVLANTTSGTVVITGTEVKGTISANSHAGGLVGIAGGTTTFGSTDAETKAKDKVTSNVTFTNSTVYGNVTSKASAGTFGQFIGQVGNTATAIINVDCTATGAFDKSKSGSGLKFSYNRATDDDEIIGYFKGNSTLIGYSPAAASIQYGMNLGTENALTLVEFSASSAARNFNINEEETCEYTFRIDGSNANAIDKSGVIVGTANKTATVYHNSFVGEEY